MAAPLISVVIPFLNPPADFLREAVYSVAAQDYEPLELLLVNDGSDEASVNAAKSLADEVDIAASIVEHPGSEHRGLSATRNRGALAATGEYLAFLDADDVWLPGKLAEQARLLRENPQVALVFGLTRYWYSWHTDAEKIGQDFVVRRGVDRQLTLPPPTFVTRFLRGRIIVPSASNNLIRRSAFLACGGFEESFRDMYEDQAFLVKLGLENSVMAVPRCWDYYRQHPGSIMGRATAAGAEDNARRRFLDWVRRYFLDCGNGTPEVWEALNKEIWLSGAHGSDSRGTTHRIKKRLKRRWLRLEEFLLPARVRHRIWAGRRTGADVGNSNG